MIRFQRQVHGQTRHYIGIIGKLAVVITLKHGMYFALQPTKTCQPGDKAIPVFFAGWLTNRVARRGFTKKKFAVIIPGIALMLGRLDVKQIEKESETA
jgi:hypothetical protein